MRLLGGEVFVGRGPIVVLGIGIGVPGMICSGLHEVPKNSVRNVKLLDHPVRATHLTQDSKLWMPG